MRYFNDELSNMSYTNKDFSAIYPELLDFADSISDKWKPSLSNESDPGVVLLKLAALMADKNNYNIDKNILELFPMSVTQYANAREIYDQCGYSMHYYRAAEVVVSLTPDNIVYGEETPLDNGDAISLPMFTTVSGPDNSIAYTLICDLVDSAWESSNIYPEVINLNYGKTTDFVALQGKTNVYMLNGSDYITYENLDYNNRIYFDERQIAENGIFITNINKDDSSENLNNFNKWVRVDNLWTQPPESYCYKLGISRDTGRVYIEFPSDIAKLVQAGLRIYYLVTDGAKGGVQARYIDSFLDKTCKPLEVSTKGAKLDVDSMFSDGFTNENIHITNSLVSSVGKDPETVDEAYRAYEKHKNTFDTLVSIVDYNNYLRQDHKYLSNGFICDRTNDIQHTYKIKSYYNGKTNTELEFEKIRTTESEESSEKAVPYLNAFNLRIYGLQGNSSITDGSEASFKLSFTPVVDNLNIGNLRNFTDDMFENTQTICHDFKPLTEGRLAFIFLEFIIDAKIIPYTKLDTLQQASVYGYVYSALLKLLNSTNIEFGQAIDYDTVYDTIKSADSRIQSLILDDISYTPVYYVRDSNATIRKLDSTDPDDKKLIEDIEQEIAAKCVLAGVTPLYIFDKKFTYPVGATDPCEYTDISSIQASWEKEFTNAIVDGKKMYEHVLQSNENIYLKAPNYVTQEQFGAFVKCFYQLGDEPAEDEGEKSSSSNLEVKILKNSTYQLKENDYIAFFWKVDDDSSYEFKIFKAGSFIQPQYTIKGNTVNTTQTSGHQDEDKKIREFIKQQPVDSTTHSVTGSLSSNFNVESAVSTIQDLTLSSKQTISIVSPNNIEIKPEAKLYFRRNNITDTNEYELHNRDILGVGEYIYYSTNPRSSLVELGAGTEISLVGISTIKVPALTSSEDIVKFSLSPLNYLQDNNLWYDCNNIAGSKLIENQFYNLSENSAIQFEGIPEDSSLKLSSTYTSLNKCTIRYKASSDETVWTTIPPIIASDDNNGWEGKTFLSITGSASTPQHLLDGHKIDLDPSLEANDPKKRVISENSYIQFYPELKLLGDSGSYTLTDSDVKAYTYSLSAGYDDAESIVKEITGTDNTSVDIDCSVTLLEGEYLLPFDFTGPRVDFHKYGEEGGNPILIYIDGKLVKDTSNSDGERLYHLGRNYLQLSASEKTTFNIKFTIMIKEGHPNYLTIHKPLLYTVHSPLTDVFGANWQTLANTYDSDSKFQYDLEIPEADMISDPLTAKAFLDSNHPFNKCTICKWKLPSEVDNQIKITNKIK